MVLRDQGNRQMKLQDLTDEQLCYLAAKGQGWTLHDTDGLRKDETLWFWKGAPRTTKGSLQVKHYDPINNGQQAMDLLREFQINLRKDGKAWKWVAFTPTADWKPEENRAVANTPEKAIVLAFVASVYGEDIEEELLG